MRKSAPKGQLPSQVPPVSQTSPAHQVKYQYSQDSHIQARDYNTHLSAVKGGGVQEADRMYRGHDGGG